ENEYVSADKGIRPVESWRRTLRGAGCRSVHQGSCRAIIRDQQRRLGPFPERIQFLQNSVFVDTEIYRLQPVDVVVLTVGNGEGQHAHVDLHPENRPLALLSAQPGYLKRRARRQTEKFSARNDHGFLPDGILFTARPSVR